VDFGRRKTGKKAAAGDWLDRRGNQQAYEGQHPLPHGKKRKKKSFELAGSRFDKMRILNALVPVVLLAAEGAAQPNSQSNPWRIWDNQSGGSSAFAEYYPIGNGRIGIMTSGDARTEQIRLNENSFWSGGKLNRVNPDGLATVKEMRRLILDGKYTEAEDLGLMGYTGTPLSTRHYDKMGNLRLIQTLPEGQVSNYERWLDVDEAVAGVYFSVGNITFEREYLSSYPDDIVAIRIKASKPGSVHLRVRLDRGSDLNRYQGFSEAANGHSTVMGGQSMDVNPLQWAAGARISASGGRVTTLGDTIRCEGADEATVFFQAWTSYRKADPKKAVVADLAAVAKSFNDIRKAHVADYQKYAQRVSLSLGQSTPQQRAQKTSARMIALTPAAFDAELVSLFFQFNRYLFISTSRPDARGAAKDTSLPPNLQGIWNDVYHPVWGSKYTLNINLQMNYWPSLVSGLSDLVTPLNNILKAMHREGAKVARAMYNCSGTVTHHNTDLWGDSAPQDNYTPGTFWPMGATWMITHVIEHFRYTGDKATLLDMVPTLRAIAEFALDFLTEYKGYLVTNPSSSPENTFVIPNGKPGESASVSPGPTLDNQLLHELFSFLPQALHTLNLSDASFVARLAAARSKLPPLRLNQYSGIAEWMHDYEEANPGNGHVSHLAAVYPLGHITSANETLFRAAVTSLNHRVEYGGAGCGWPRAWAVALAARLFLAEEAGNRLVTQMGSECTWNRTMLNMGGAAPFQIDGNLAAVGAMGEVVVQSHELVFPSDTSDGKGLRAAGTGDEGAEVLIRLLPSLPKAWTKNGGGFVKGLKARGGYNVDLNWDEDGRLKSAALTSEGGNPAYVTLGQARVGGTGGSAIQANGTAQGVFIHLGGRKGEVYNITLKK